LNDKISTFQIGDGAHLKAVSEMQELMKSPSAMQAWMADKKKEFDNLSEDN